MNDEKPLTPIQAMRLIAKKMNLDKVADIMDQKALDKVTLEYSDEFVFTVKRVKPLRGRKPKDV